MRQSLRPLCWVARHCATELAREAGRTAPRETGGVLVGWQMSNGETVIERIIGPGPRAVHEPERFVPDYEYQEAAIVEIFRASDGKLTYLGDWHSHPAAGAYLSPADQATLKRIAEHSESGIRMPMMAIVAGGDPWLLAVWQYRPSGVYSFAYRAATISCRTQYYESVDKVT